MGLGLQQDISAQCGCLGDYRFPDRIFHPAEYFIGYFFRAHWHIAGYMGGFKKEYNDGSYDFYDGHDFYINSKLCFDFLCTQDILL